jgi:hypothetical protein
MAVSTQQTREIYLVTRSEATWLVNTYMKALKKGADGSMEPHRIFRNALETAKPAYLGKYNGTHEGLFYKIATDLFTTIEELDWRVDETDHHAKTMDAAKHLHCKHSIAYLTATSLNWSVYNWHNKPYAILAEELGDNYYEQNTCTICEYAGEDWFYYSTSYGLEKPVCEHCLPYEEKIDKHDEDYVESEAEEEDDEDSDDDEDYEPDASASEAEDSEAEDSEADESDSDDEGSANEADDSESDSASEAGEEFGCKGCNWEWRDGWKYGYKAALKHLHNYADQQKRDLPAAPRCANCDISHGDLRRCSGDCGGLARYCSQKCQKEDWPEHMKICKA